MVIDWGKQIDECIRDTELHQTFHGGSVERRLEEILCVKRLMEMGYDDAKILAWMALAGAGPGICLDEVWDMMAAAKRRRWPKRHDFRVWITMAEIERIDSLQETRECKSFLLGAVAFAKMMTIKRKKPTFNVRERSYCYWIAMGSDDYSVGRHREPYMSAFLSRMIRQGVVSTKVAKTSYKVWTGRRGGAVRQILNVVLQGDWIEWGARDGYEIKTLERDVKALCDRAFKDPTRRCESCGREFPVSPRSRKTVCDECQREKRAQKSRIYMRAARKGAGVGGKALLTCPVCGKTYEAGPKLKTSMCAECYAKHRKELRRLAQLNRRQKARNLKNLDRTEKNMGEARKVLTDNTKNVNSDNKRTK